LQSLGTSTADRNRVFIFLASWDCETRARPRLDERPREVELFTESVVRVLAPAAMEIADLDRNKSNGGEQPRQPSARILASVPSRRQNAHSTT
jgi:hypothetical protein